MDPMDPDELERELQANWLSRSQASHVAGTSAEWLRTLAERGRIRAIRTPAGTLFLRRDVERIAAERAERRADHGE